MRLPIFALILTVAACTPDPADVSPDVSEQAVQTAEDAIRDAGPIDIDVDGMAISSTLSGDPVESILTQGGEVELGITDSVLYSRLSKETQAQILDDMDAKSESDEGLGGRIARAAARAVAQGVGTAIQVPLADVRDVRYEGGRLVIEMVDGEPSPFERSSTDDKPMLEQVSARDGERLADAFDRVRSQ